MCGITGYYCPETVSSSSILPKMMAVIKHRGPDGEGTWIDEEENIAMGHLRLSIIDLEGGKQPFISPDQNYIITFNGEIYNYIELRQLLIHKGYGFKTHSDTEVLLKMYIEFGAEMLNMLNGMFAFSIYNKKDKTLFLARDHFGIKPLYYYKVNNFFAFASEIKSLLQHPKVKIEKNEAKIQEYLVLQMIIGKETLYDKIFKLEPATYLIVKDGIIVKEEQYWDLDYTVDYEKTEDQFSKELLLLIQSSVSMQLRSDVPVGSYLSGGLDSSIVSKLASSNYPNKINTFTGGFKLSEAYNETHYARIVAEKIKSIHHEVFPTAQDFIDNIESLIYQIDEPLAGPGLFPQYMVSKLAAKHVKVVLGGHGGDELFGGYARYGVAYLEECIKGSIFDTQNDDSHIVTLNSIIENLPSLKQYVPLIKSQFSSGLFDPMDQRYFRLISRSHNLSEIYKKDYLKSIEINNVFEHFSSVFNKPKTSSYFNKMTYYDTKTLLPALLHIEDRVSMAVSIESRVPLLDRRIAELAASIPPVMKFTKGKLKYMLLKSVGAVLPKQIVERKDKMGFPTPLNEWMKGPLKEYMMDTLLSNQSKQRGMYRIDQIEKQLKLNNKFSRDIWGVLNLELWQRNL